MPLYRSVLHGRATLPEGPGGFFTTRWCWAQNENSATHRMQRIVREKWTGPTIETLEIDSIWRIRFRDIWRAPNRGSTFYTD